MVRVSLFHWLTGMLLLLVLLAIAAPGDAAPGARPAEFKAVGPEQLVYSWYSDRCDGQDTPDAPPRAFRDFKGQIHLFATHEANRALIGPDFDHLSHVCTIAYQGDHADDPSLFDDRQWLTSFFSKDGHRIFAIVHDEFHGYLRPRICPSRTYRSCWYNALTFALSTDGGYTFQQPRPPTNLLAAPPYTYQGDYGRPLGYFQPSNIVQQGRYFYFMFLAAGFRSQDRGICVARTDNPADPRSWRGWNGKDYNVNFVDPYRTESFDMKAHTCAPVGKGRIFELGSLSYDPALGSFVAVSGISEGNQGKRLLPGAYVSTSPDLIEWSEPVALEDGALLPLQQREYRFEFFSMIDERSDSTDFDTISGSPFLFLYYVKLSKRDASYGRLLVKRRVEIKYTTN